MVAQIRLIREVPQQGLLLLALWLAALIVAMGVAATAQIDYPGTQAYSELDRYLDKHSKTDSLEFNLNLIRELVQSIHADSSLKVTPKRLLAPAELVLALAQARASAASSGAKCDLATNQLVKYNLMGTLPDRTKCRLYDHPKHLRTSKLAAIIYNTTLEIVAHSCERTIEAQLEGILASLAPARAKSYHLLRAYLSEAFIDEHARLTADFLSLERVSLRLESADEQEFGRLPHPMILDQLFRVASNISAKIPRTKLRLASPSPSLELASWPQLDQAQLCDLIDRHILAPCGDFVAWTRPGVFEMFHWLRGHFSAQSFDMGAFLRGQSREFRYQVFRYDFCDTLTGAFSKLWLWQSYKELVFPTQRIHKRA